MSRGVDVAPYSTTLCRWSISWLCFSPSPNVSEPCLDPRKFIAEKASTWSWRMALINACSLSGTVEGTATKVKTIFFPPSPPSFPCRKNKTTAKQLDRQSDYRAVIYYSNFLQDDLKLCNAAIPPRERKPNFSQIRSSCACLFRLRITLVFQCGLLRKTFPAVFLFFFLLPVKHCAALWSVGWTANAFQFWSVNSYVLFQSKWCLANVSLTKTCF